MRKKAQKPPDTSPWTRLSFRRWAVVLALLEGSAGRSLAMCVRWGDLDWVLIVAHFEDVHCVNSVGLGRRSSATEQGTCPAGSLVGLAGSD